MLELEHCLKLPEKDFETLSRFFGDCRCCESRGIDSTVSVTVSNRIYKFDLEFHCRFNFITGNSGDSKTQFVNLCKKRK